jgi:hypothetical protein
MIPFASRPDPKLRSPPPQPPPRPVLASTIVVPLTSLFTARHVHTSGGQTWPRHRHVTWAAPSNDRISCRIGRVRQCCLPTRGTQIGAIRVTNADYHAAAAAARTAGARAFANQRPMTQGETIPEFRWFLGVPGLRYRGAVAIAPAVAWLARIPAGVFSYRAAGPAQSNASLICCSSCLVCWSQSAPRSPAW